MIDLLFFLVFVEPVSIRGFFYLIMTSKNVGTSRYVLTLFKMILLFIQFSPILIG